MKELDEKEFADLFYLEIVNKLKDIRAEQKRLHMAPTLWMILGVASFVLWGILVAMADNVEKIIGHNTMGIILFTWFIAMWSSPFYVPNIIVKKQRKVMDKIKNKVYNIILGKFDLTYCAVTKEIQEKYEKIYKQLNISTQKLIIDDIISGEYNNIPFSILDCAIGNGFCGILVATKINKKFSKEIFIKRKTNEDNIINLINTSGCKKTVLEDVEFNALFDVITQDPIEARYMLTTTFMERLKTYQSNTGYNINAVFSHRTYSDYNLFLFINTGENHFELSIERKNTSGMEQVNRSMHQALSNYTDVNIYEKNHYYNIYSEIKEILKIVDALKLDQNIGM